MSNIANRKKLYRLSFFIPLIIYMIIGYKLRLYPLSDNTILFSDMNSQFIHFYNFFKNIITTNNDFLYTFSKTLGGDMMGFSAYYLQSPFILILLMFPYEMMPLGIFIMEAVMLSSASLSFMYFLCNVFDEFYLKSLDDVIEDATKKKKTGYSKLIFSTAYGMMGYVIAYFMLPIWFNNIILLPLVITGFHKMLNREKKGACLYTITLALSIFCNYYFGYMLCLFLVVYFAYYSIASFDSGFNYVNQTTSVINNKLCMKDFFTNLRLFFLYSVLGVALSCFDLIPVALSLRDQKDAPSTSIFELKRMFRLVDLYKTLLPARFNSDFSNQSLPYIYVGLIPVFCVLLFFINKKIKRIEKIATFLLIGTLVISLYIKPLDTIWHAFNEPVGFAHRFAFLLSFVLLMVGYKGYMVSNMKKVAALAIVFSMCELSYNAQHVLRMQVATANTESTYMEFYERIMPVLDNIKAREGDDKLYRVEKDIMYTMVDAMAFDYAGLSHNSSCEKYKVKSFMGNMGFRNQGIWAFYNQGSTTFADSFLGMKYFISRFDGTDKPYNMINSTEDTYAFENPYALRFASLLDEDMVRSFNADENNTFVFQNNIAKCYGINENVMEEANVSEIRISGDIEISEDFRNRAANNGTLISEVDGVSVTDDSVPAKYAEFDIDILEPGKTLYFYLGAKEKQGARIYLNGMDWDDYFSDWRWAIERLGTFPVGEKVTVRVEATGDELYIGDYLFYHENPEVLKEWYEHAVSLGANTVELEKIKSSHLKGTFNATDDSMLVFSMPYDKGWHIKIDGASVSQEEVVYALMGVSVKAGEHAIEMRYIPEGLIAGIIITIIAFMVFYIVFMKRRELQGK